jgi:hypothetical protein
MWSTSFGSAAATGKSGSFPGVGGSGGGVVGTALDTGENRPPTSPTRASQRSIPPVSVPEPRRITAETSARVRRRSAGLPVQPAAAPAAQGRSSRSPLLMIVVLAVAAGLVVGVVVLRTERSGPDAAPAVAASATATLEIRTEPAGAHVFVDGSPSGMLTPAILKGLPVGRTLQLSLDKQGYQPVSQQARLEQGQSQTLSFTLREAQGVVRLKGVPRNAIAYLDDQQVDADKPIPAATGQHRLRVELADGVVFSNSIEVKMGGELVVDVARDRSKQ